jgi:transcription elongation factor SPT5
LLELADLVDISKLRVRIKGTLEEKYLDGKYESLLVHILSTKSASNCFEHTALVRFESTSEECNLLMHYLVPDPPSKQDQLAVVLHESRQGHTVKVKQRPNEGMPIEQLVVESLMSGGSSFWECQKDWMCALW